MILVRNHVLILPNGRRPWPGGHRVGEPPARPYSSRQTGTEPFGRECEWESRLRREAAPERHREVG